MNSQEWFLCCGWRSCELLGLVMFHELLHIEVLWAFGVVFVSCTEVPRAFKNHYHELLWVELLVLICLNLSKLFEGGASFLAPSWHPLDDPFRLYEYFWTFGNYFERAGGGGGLQFFWHHFDELFRFCGYVWELKIMSVVYVGLKIKEWYRLNNLNLFLCIRESTPFKKEGALVNCELPTAHCTSNFIQHTCCCLQLWQKKHVT